MLEARARIPACAGLESINGNYGDVFREATPATRVRLLHSVLPSAKKLLMLR